MLWGARAAVGAVPGGIHGGQRPHHAPGVVHPARPQRRRRLPCVPARDAGTADAAHGAGRRGGAGRPPQRGPRLQAGG
eukprot:SM010408S14105  [mRNA]  locus=s10408:28:436:- [translate_table: standard]